MSRENAKKLNIGFSNALFENELDGIEHVTNCMTKLVNSSIIDIYGDFPGTMKKLLELPGCCTNGAVRLIDPLCYLYMAFTHDHLDSSTIDQKTYNEEVAAIEHVAERHLMVPLLKGNKYGTLLSFTPENLYYFSKANNLNEYLKGNGDLLDLMRFHRHETFYDILINYYNKNDYDNVRSSFSVLFGALLFYEDVYDKRTSDFRPLQYDMEYFGDDYNFHKSI